MKKLGIISMAVLMLGIGTLNTGCMGSFAISKKFYSWNESATGNKYINGLLFILLFAVYGITLTIDLVILNLIEFWTGSNPAAMAPGEKEQQTVTAKDGNQYEITATQNRFDIVVLTGNKKGEHTGLVYTPNNTSWSVEKNGVTTKFATLHADIDKVEIFHADGSVSLHDMGQARIGSLLQAGLAN
jgi:hypothetical protein